MPSGRSRGFVSYSMNVYNRVEKDLTSVSSKRKITASIINKEIMNRWKNLPEHTRRCWENC